MAAPGDVLEIPALGLRVEFRTTAAETDGELLEFDSAGRPQGFITLPHMHPLQTERHEVIEGRFRIRTGALERLLGPGEAVETPPGVEHRHGAAGDGPLRVRVQIRPALRFAEWLERVAAMDRDGDLAPGGWPKPAAAARLLLDFPGEAHGTVPPLRMQQAAARAILKVAHNRR
jgi:quercetin dioxygenase-like cupin family protein